MNAPRPAEQANKKPKKATKPLPSASAVIPVRNEAAWLPRLITALKDSRCVGEIVVADGGSTDGTVAVALREGCIVTPGGKPGVGRNIGARQSTGEVIVFADADVVPNGRILRKALKRIGEEDYLGVYFRFTPITKRMLPKFTYLMMDLHFWGVSQFGIAQGLGTLILVKRSAFDQIGGFDETIKVGEDADFLRRLSQIGRVRYERHPPVPVSARRFHMENGLTYFAKCFLWAMLRLFNLKTSMVDYRWGRYDDSLVAEEAPLLERIEAEQEAAAKAGKA